MVWSMLVHRKALGSEPSSFSHRTTLAYAWSRIPIFIVFGMPVPETSSVVAMYEYSVADLTLQYVS